MLEPSPPPRSDAALRRAFAIQLRRMCRDLERAQSTDEAFVASMTGRPIAEHPKLVGAQLYELPTTFFQACLGPRLKFSCALFDTPETTLAEAEARALAETCRHADLKDGQRILELGCGWGSLTLWMAQAYPNARIVAVSNSHLQRQHIEAETGRLGLGNVEVLSADMNDLTMTERFDRIVSVEMFEHMANWRLLLENCALWLAPNGRLFLHVFAHATTAYRYDLAEDWVAKHFFAGGLMPSRTLAHAFPDLFEVEAEWRWSGRHYQRTAIEWLRGFDANIGDVRDILTAIYAGEAEAWEQNWRLFFLSMAELYGFNDGETWGVMHYRLACPAKR